jgi:hypothetical protein
MAWDEYSARVEQALRQLLDSKVCNEKEFQRLIEQHPSLLPWSYGTFGGGHHGLLHGALVSQPRLVGLAGKQPDFMYIATDSDSTYAVFVEIESPCKPWFTKEGQPQAKLTQAINQLRQWKHWFEQPGNEIKFRREYAVPGDAINNPKRFQQRYYLIYGTRKNLQESGYADHRSHHQQPDEHFFSYDHLTPQIEHRDTITVKVDKKGYRALSIPPTLRLGPVMARFHSTIRDKEKRATSHPMMDPARGSFLQKRWPYWDAWASQPGGGMIHTRDWE